jgi:hypothetical protein
VAEQDAGRMPRRPRPRPFRGLAAARRLSVPAPRLRAASVSDHPVRAVMVVHRGDGGRLSDPGRRRGAGARGDRRGRNRLPRRWPRPGSRRRPRGGPAGRPRGPAPHCALAVERFSLPHCLERQTEVLRSVL